jgi:shikimate dehydrogenase
VSYQLFDYKEADQIPGLEELFKNQLTGLSITAPYKEHFLGDVKIEDQVVRDLGAINCVKRDSEGFLATNTDLNACREILRIHKKNGVDRFIILGSGAMSRVTQACLKEMGVNFEIYSRSKNGEISHLDLRDKAKGQTLVINTCAREYIFNGQLSEGAIFWDHNYSNQQHLDNFSQVFPHVVYRDGMELLEFQAVFALKFWNLSPKTKS